MPAGGIAVSSIAGEVSMLYEKLSSKSMAEIDLALRAEAGLHRFGVLHVHDLQQTMKSKDVEYS